LVSKPLTRLNLADTWQKLFGFWGLMHRFLWV
jgi:hypothetical protein